MSSPSVHSNFPTANQKEMEMNKLPDKEFKGNDFKEQLMTFKQNIDE